LSQHAKASALASGLLATWRNGSQIESLLKRRELGGATGEQPLVGQLDALGARVAAVAVLARALADVVRRVAGAAARLCRPPGLRLQAAPEGEGCDQKAARGANPALEGRASPR